MLDRAAPGAEANPECDRGADFQCQPFRMQGQAAAIRSDTTVGFKFTPLSKRVRAQLEELIEELAADWRKRFAAHRWYAEDF